MREIIVLSPAIKLLLGLAIFYTATIHGFTNYFDHKFFDVIITSNIYWNLSCIFSAIALAVSLKFHILFGLFKDKEFESVTEDKEYPKDESKDTKSASVKESGQNSFRKISNFIYGFFALSISMMFFSLLSDGIVIVSIILVLALAMYIFGLRQGNHNVNHLVAFFISFSWVFGYLYGFTTKNYTRDYIFEMKENSPNVYAKILVSDEAGYLLYSDKEKDLIYINNHAIVSIKIKTTQN